MSNNQEVKEVITADRRETRKALTQMKPTAQCVMSVWVETPSADFSLISGYYKTKIGQNKL